MALWRARARRREAMSADRWLVLGLGNPDNRYGGTRHNVGAACVDLLARRLGVRPSSHKSGAFLADAFTPARRVAVTLGRPGGFMNTSGGPTQAALSFYKLPLERLVVLHDEMDLPVGTIRLKFGGGTSGHNGLRDIQRRCGASDFHRVRLGVGRPPGRMDPARHVLMSFAADEKDEAAIMVERGADAVLALIEDGLSTAQNRYHAG